MNSLLDLIGNTPLLKLGRTTDDAKPLVLAKVEYLNPGGSVKDRIATRMIEAAEASGELRARRHDRRADLGQHRRGARDGRAGQGLPMRVRVPGQGQRGQAQRPRGVRRRGGRLPDRCRARTTRTPTTASPTGWCARSRARGSPTSTPTRTTRARTTRPPAPRSGSRPTAAITHFVAGVGTGGHDQRRRAVPQGAEPCRADRRRRPGRLGVLRRHRSPLPRRGRR